MKCQGDIAELKFILLNKELGYIVSKPFGEDCKYDVIVDTGEELQRVQVKSTRNKETANRKNCYNCGVCSGHDSKKRYTEDSVDYIAIYVIPENAWYKIPIKEIKGKTVKLYPHRNTNFTYEKFRIT